MKEICEEGQSREHSPVRVPQKPYAGEETHPRRGGEGLLVRQCECNFNCAEVYPPLQKPPQARPKGVDRPPVLPIIEAGLCDGHVRGDGVVDGFVGAEGGRPGIVVCGAWGPAEGMRELEGRRELGGECEREAAKGKGGGRHGAQCVGGRRTCPLRRLR